ncbi:bifunctional demethylmenaquinone methyltransferase/2-methoxy-6-polyprenyl-1,4-benzoquinol methylase UbiE [Rickettsiales endosymbiont of Stachyamoeba lipophora]|uniref:bifunctional demethylmenaquinone methyltransferase/2-methoxy-6-polyprenyl-1,4-benzoquinol methylase UbiE n=1 Tax=Rickettsiales endosymbiont of Stachyamoeba lipophora TaxID=2486578 RepID=UPI000F655836|nr:bifunctional demethylmenaquinone methyltransferase/2-methoxy-6-polyprenyl-1,4-benzoquinol methylase UbiE [Rickettsiales endosymbiont of Stachyamoeba lipophora]AZL15755.1 bifunctional demethylmenaquinone methyltransferase/2-methoxy-6-polyprenyl-1,4-benzoquinol methylase UbiE [Rickettsiales endosymbiont of Stachyamoeba lipophora]
MTFNINDNEQNSQADFGFKKVNRKEKTGLVSQLFGSVAKNYDLMNDLMSLGIHKLWKRDFIKFLPTLTGQILDLASGTGDIAINIARYAQKEKGISANITLCDLNFEMLNIGQSKVIDNLGVSNFTYAVADGEKLPFKDNSFDIVTIAFGIRNITNINIALREIHRVLRPGGKFICLEFSSVNHSFKKFYEFYLLQIIPKVGKLVANDYEAYRYLSESIIKFPNQESFKKMMETQGLKNVGYHNLSQGVAAIHYGWKF